MTLIDTVRLFVIAAGVIIMIHGLTELVDLMGSQAATVLTRLSLVIFTMSALIDMCYRLRTPPTWRLWVTLAAVVLGLGGILAAHRRD